MKQVSGVMWMLLLAAGVFAFFLDFAPVDVFASVCVSDTDISGGVNHNLGQDSDHQAEAQQFTLGSSCTVTSIGAWLDEVSSPSDELVFAIWSDNSGLPGTVIASSTSDVTVTNSGSGVEYTAPFASVALTAGVYEFVIARTGAVSSAAYQWYGANNNTTNSNLKTGGWDSFDDGGSFAYEVDSSGGGGGGGGGGTSTSTPPNGLGSLFVVSFMWYCILLCEMLLLFIPIIVFVWMLRKMFVV